ncbi:hypothetical protein ACFY1S_26540 [Micromonospora sp. NPDC000663]
MNLQLLGGPNDEVGQVGFGSAELAVSVTVRSTAPVRERVQQR